MKQVLSLLTGIAIASVSITAFIPSSYVLRVEKVTVTWWTHAISGLHRNDFIMAAKTDAIAT